MTPLVFDPFFASLAVTFIFGLTFATLLTLVFVPVLYLTIHRVAAPLVAMDSTAAAAD
jgi:multidrug efflux pump subunit AcrB